MQNEHIKLTQTHQDTQTLSKAHLQNIIDILGRLMSKHHQISHTAYEKK